MRSIRKAGKITSIILVLLIAGGLLSANTIRDYYIKSHLEPGVELAQSSKNMEKASSYRYALESGFTVDGRKEVISSVAGEKSNLNTHIKGEMVHTPVDIYYVNRTIYNYDSFADKWLVIESDTSNAEELLISELKPLSNFRFKQVGEVEKVGFEDVDGTECLVVRCQPSVENQLLETLWQDFTYQFWIDYQQRLIKKANLTAANKQNAGTRLKLEASFKDINEKIVITPPDTGK